jgi:membrane protein
MVHHIPRRVPQRDPSSQHPEEPVVGLARIIARAKANPVYVFASTAIGIFNDQRVIGLAQQIAYNFLFSIAPLLIVLTAFGGLVVQQVNADLSNPVQPVLAWLEDHLPEEAYAFLEVPIESALTTDPSYLLSIGGILALWAAKNAVASIMRGLSATYGLRHDRPFLAHNIVAILLTICTAIGIVTAAALQILSSSIGNEIAKVLNLGAYWEDMIGRLQWPISVAMVTFLVLLLHRFGPTFEAPFRWYLPGVAVTLIGIGLATWALQVYFSIADEFASAYGVFGAALAFIFWMYVIGLVFLIGGIVNATLFEEFPPARRALSRYREKRAGKEDPADRIKAAVLERVNTYRPGHDEPPT